MYRNVTFALAVLLALIVGVDFAVTDSSAESTSAYSIVGTISFYEEAAAVQIVAAFVPGKGWLESEDALGLLHQGDRLSLYALERGLLGEVVLTSEGRLKSEEHVGPGASRGLYYRARVEVLPEKHNEYEAARKLREIDWWQVDLVAASADDSRAVRWVKATPLPGACERGSPHHAAVADWLRSRGIPDAGIEGTEIIQAVRADVDGNGQDEVLLSIRCAWYWTNEDGDMEGKELAYLVVRRIMPGTAGVETLVLHHSYDYGWRSLLVCGLQDLDGDGWAEVITRGQGVDYGGAQLFHWDGRRFAEVNGWGGGA